MCEAILVTPAVLISFQHLAFHSNIYGICVELPHGVSKRVGGLGRFALKEGGRSRDQP